jgi:hypothetical protein
LPKNDKRSEFANGQNVPISTQISLSDNWTVAAAFPSNFQEDTAYFNRSKQQSRFTAAKLTQNNKCPISPK